MPNGSWRNAWRPAPAIVRDGMHLDALRSQILDGRVEVVDAEREVVAARRRFVGLHQVHLLAAGVEPVAGPEVGSRQRRATEHVAVERQARIGVGDADRDVVHSGRSHRAPKLLACRRWNSQASASEVGIVGALDGKVIAVTGAGRGIGRAVALGAAAEGAAVVVNDYGVSIDGNEPTSEVADAVVKEITDAGGRAAANAQSVTTMEGGASIVQQAIDTFGRIDGVVCVAGILRERMLFNMSEEEWDPVIETHLKGTFTVFRAAAPVFRPQKSGTLIGFTSGAFAASVAQANYSAAKGGIVSLVRSAAAGMYKYGVTSNCIAPVAKSRMSGNVPFGLEMGEPEDIAPMVVLPALRSGARDHRSGVHGQRRTRRGVEPAVRGARDAQRRPMDSRAARRLGSARSARSRCRSSSGSRRWKQAAKSGDKPNQ